MGSTLSVFRKFLSRIQFLLNEQLRDKMSDEMKRCRTKVRLSAELHQQPKNAAHQNSTRESDTVRGVLERQFADEAMTAYEHVKETGLIGAVRGTDRDLSTNPKHFDGFGQLK